MTTNLENEMLTTSTTICDISTLDDLVKKVTENYISSLSSPRTKEDDELKSELSAALNNELDKQKQLGKKLGPTFKALPDASVAALIAAKYPVRCISWNGKDADSGFLAAYQSDGANKGLYVSSDTYFGNLVHRFKYTADTNSVNEVVSKLKELSPKVQASKDPDLIAVNNGIFDYKTKTLLPFSEDMVFLSKSRVDYVPNAMNPHITMPDGIDWDVETWFASLSDNSEIIKLLWEVVGAIIRPNCPWNLIVCLFSTAGMNGKGSLCELLKQICGDETWVSIPLDKFEKDAYVSQLRTASAVICDENNTNSYTKDAANLKAAATGDAITCDIKYKEAQTFRFSGLIVECINQIIRASDSTNSFYRRFLTIPFDKTFIGIERKYIKTDYLHRADVLQYVLCKVLNTNYYEFSIPKACIDLLEEVKERNNPLIDFADDVMDKLVWNKVPGTFVYELYKKWMAKNNPHGTALGRNTFFSEFRSILNSKYSEEWQFVPKITIGKSDNLQPETMIFEYGIDEWRNSEYKGGDIDKICMPIWNSDGYKRSYQRISNFISQEEESNK